MSATKSRRRKKRKALTKNYDDDDDDLDDAAVNAELRMFGFCVDDEPEDDASRWGYDLQSKITCERFTEHSEQLIERLEGKDYNANYFHHRGFKKPIYFDKSDGLDLIMPSAKDFTVNDVKKLVGSSRVIDVVDVKTQKGSQMTLREFVDYFQRPDRKKLLNVLSLEFSKTKLAEYVRAPAAVRELDWVELAWPRELREQQTDSTNALNAMKYPKVQNYCLMSVGNCYTDFHVDFGGTSVWYHILRGEKIFWLIPPTEENCQHFQAWTLSGRQHMTFFGDLVEQCVRVKLKAGDTFMIPSGWFHAVFTPVDSLVFGGNFLHSFAIPMQLSVYEIERNTHVPVKFRYPFFLEMQWYVLERYYSVLTGRSFLRRNNLESDEGASSSTTIMNLDLDGGDEVPTLREDKAVLISDVELEGLHILINWLESLPGSKRRVPDQIERPEVLLRNFRELLSKLQSIAREPSPAHYTVLSCGKQKPSPKINSEKNTAAKQSIRRHIYQKRIKKDDQEINTTSFIDGAGVYADQITASTSTSREIGFIQHLKTDSSGKNGVDDKDFNVRLAESVSAVPRDNVPIVAATSAQLT